MDTDRELQLYDGAHATCDLGDYSFTIDDPHILFDVNLDGALESFFTILDEYYAPAAVLDAFQAADAKGSDDALFVFEQAIGEVLTLDATYHEGATDVAAENLYSSNPDAFESCSAPTPPNRNINLVVYSTQPYGNRSQDGRGNQVQA